MRYKKWISALIFSLLILTHNPVFAQSGSALEIIQLINQFRVNNGLPAFQINQSLVSAAQNQANYMSEYGVFSSHIGYGGSTPQSRANAAGYKGIVSENIVGGTDLNARQGLNWWLNSPVHYNTLVTSRYSEAGTAFATNGDANFFVLVVGRKINAATPPSNGDDSPAPLYITPITLAQAGEDGSIVHEVQDGQALWTLAAYYEVPLSDLILFNQLNETDFVQPGDQIIIRLPDGAEPPPTPTPSLFHTVQEGQSLWSIALRYDLRFGDLLLFNGFDETAVLQPGDEIKIRLAPGEAPPATPTPIIFHTIQSGQTLWDIALTYGLDLQELLAFNEGLTADSILQIGDQIQVRNLSPTPLPPTETVVSTQTPIVQTPTIDVDPTQTMTPGSTSTPESTPATPIEPQPDSTENGRTSLSTVLFMIAGLLAVTGGGFVWWSRVG